MIIAIFLFIILLTLSGSFFLYKYGLKLRKNLQLIEREGRQVTGRLTKLNRRRMRNGTIYSALVNYQIDGQEYTCERIISSTNYNTWSEGMPLELKYAASKPDVAFLVNDRAAAGWLWWLIGAAILLVATIILIGIMIIAGVHGQLFL